MTERKDTCETCKFWTNKTSEITDLKLSGPFGECRKYAPRGPISFGFTQEVIVRGYNAFPMLPGDDWCGEHKPKDGAQ